MEGMLVVLTLKTSWQFNAIFLSNVNMQNLWSWACRANNAHKHGAASDTTGQLRFFHGAATRYEPGSWQRFVTKMLR